MSIGHLYPVCSHHQSTNTLSVKKSNDSFTKKCLDTVTFQLRIFVDPSVIAEMVQVRWANNSRTSLLKDIVSLIAMASNP